MAGIDTIEVETGMEIGITTLQKMVHAVSREDEIILRNKRLWM
jgi:hypothetical protein